MVRFFWKAALFSWVIVFLLSIFARAETYRMTHQITGRDLACPSMRRHIGEGLLSDVCWDAMFPIETGDITVVSGHEEENPNDEDSLTSPLCCCCGLRDCDWSDPDSYLNADCGWLWKWWEVDRIVEVVRVPWCFPSLGGNDGAWGFWLPYIVDASGWAEVNKSWGGFFAYSSPEETHHFFNVHYYAYTPLTVLEILLAPECHAGFIMDFDLLEASEADFYWVRNGFAWFEYDSLLFANPVAALACTADCAATDVGFGINYLFWCGGCEGLLYPIKGHVNYNLSRPGVAELLAYRWLLHMHRTAKEFKTIGSAAKCAPVPWPFYVVKDQYKVQMLHPLVERGDPCAHPLGRSTFLWKGKINVSGNNTVPGSLPGESSTVAGVGEDYVYLLWRRMECCIR